MPSALRQFAPGFPLQVLAVRSASGAGLSASIPGPKSSQFIGSPEARKRKVVMSAEKKLPDGWEVKRLGEVCEKITDGSHFSPKSFSTGKYPYITVRDINDFGIDFDNCKFVSEEDYNLLVKNGCNPKKGDLLFSKDGTVGKVALVNSDKLFVILSSLAILRPKASVIYSSYLKYALQNPVFLSIALGKKTGVAIRRIILRNLKDIHIPYPPLSEQKRIVAILDEVFQAIDQVKENAVKNLANAREVFDGYLNQVFSNPGKDWEEKKLGNICEFVRGPFGGSLRKEIFKSTGYAVYEQQHAINNQFSDIRYFIDENKFNEMKRFELRPGDLIMSCSGTMGKTAIVPEIIQRGIINQALLKLTPTSMLIVDFLQIWISTENFQNQLAQFSQGAAIQNVASVKILKEISIMLPNVQTQFQIINSVQSFNVETSRLESIYQKKIADLDELKKSILQKAFSGEL